MAEVQKNPQTQGETGAHFIQFIMMHQQQALLALGRHPNPPPGGPGPNLALAKAFIDQLGAIQTLTQGNLGSEEDRLLRTSLTTLRQLYVEEVKPA